MLRLRKRRASRVNRRALVVASVTIVLSIIAGAALGQSPQIAPAKLGESQLSRQPNATSIAFGVYDPHAVFADDHDVSIDHVFIYWQSADEQQLKEITLRTAARQRMLMVTVEPYTRAADWRAGGEHLFSDIVFGAFNTEIDKICSALGQLRGRALIRWGHEMEDPTGRYPWARKDAAGYKKAYRYFVDRCRRAAPEATYIWSPKGERNLADYYPGADVVDAVGVSVYGLQQIDQSLYGKERYFPETFAEKYNRLVAFKKPVIITELGVSGDSRYKSHWLETMFQSLQSSSPFNGLEAVVYFNDKEPSRWPMGFGFPDWRTTPERLWTRREQMIVRH
jgi:endoglucanase